MPRPIPAILACPLLHAAAAAVSFDVTITLTPGPAPHPVSLSIPVARTRDGCARTSGRMTNSAKAPFIPTVEVLPGRELAPRNIVHNKNTGAPLTVARLGAGAVLWLKGAH